MLTWLVIGVGDITTKRVLPAILAEERSRLVGIVTRDPAKAEPYEVAAFTTLEPLLGNRMPLRFTSAHRSFSTLHGPSPPSRPKGTSFAKSPWP